MIDSTIPKYDFTNRKTDFGVEIVPLHRILIKRQEISQQVHRLGFYQILIFTKGKGRHHVDFNTIDYSDNTIIPVATGQVQQYEIDPQNNADGYAVLFTPEFLIKEEVDYRFLYEYIIFNHTLQPVALKSTPAIMSILESMLEDQNNPDAFDQSIMLRNQLKNLLILIEREKRNTTDIVCDASLDLYLKFRKKLEEELSYKLRVSDFCESLNATPKQINAAIKLFTSNTAKQFIEERVILEAKRLLTYSGMSIKEIAYSIGFEDPANFTKYFKARTDMSPKVYQNQGTSGL